MGGGGYNCLGRGLVTVRYGSVINKVLISGSALPGPPGKMI